MTRSPLAYPLNRGADMDVGGAADLQTDVMRFMAILALCLVAIFALVQSMPVAPPVTPVVEEIAQPSPEPHAASEPQTQPETMPVPESKPVAEAITLTRPKPRAVPLPAAQAVAEAEPIEETPPPVAPEQEGFTLRFESDAALTRLVAAHKVGVYAIDDDRARRMTVSESRISFWDASMPNSFHEMDAATVPGPVVDALVRAGVDTAGIRWGVTLPGKLKTQLDGLLQERRGGALVIEPNGTLRLEKS